MPGHRPDREPARRRLRAQGGIGHGLAPGLPQRRQAIARNVAERHPRPAQRSGRGEQPARYIDIARFLDLPAGDEAEAAASLVSAIRDLEREVGQPLSIRQALPDLTPDEFAAGLEKLVDNAEMDATIIASVRDLSSDATRRLFEYAYQGKDVDF